MAASVLVLRSSRSVYSDPAGHGNCVGGAADLLAQADLRLRVCGLLRRGDRLFGLHRLGASYVRRGDGAADQRAVLGWQLPDRRADRREDLQLDRDIVAGQYPASNTAVLRGWLCGDVYHRRDQRRYAWLAADRRAA